MRFDLEQLNRRCREYLHRPRSFSTFLTATALLVLIPIHAAIIIVMLNVQQAQRHRVVNNLHSVTMLTRAALDADVAGWQADLRSLAAMLSQ